MKASSNCKTYNMAIVLISELGFFVLFLWQIFSSLGTILRIVTFTKSGKFPTSADWGLLTVFLSLTASWVSFTCVLVCKKCFRPQALHSLWGPENKDVFSPVILLLWFDTCCEFETFLVLSTLALLFSFSGQFQALIEFSNTSEAELAKLVRSTLSYKAVLLCRKFPKANSARIQTVQSSSKCTKHKANVAQLWYHFKSTTYSSLHFVTKLN